MKKTIVPEMPGPSKPGLVVFLLVFGPFLVGPAGSSGAERTFVLRDFTGRGFAPDLVHYRVALEQGKHQRLRLYGQNGAPLPVQVSETWITGFTVSFVADMPPGGTASYVLRDDGRGDVPASSLKVESTRDGLCISNGLLAVRLPGEMSKNYRNPLPAKDFPAPILAFRSGQSGWLGESKFLTDRRVSACSISLDQEGPVYAELWYALGWAEGGFYRARIQVIDRVPVVKVWEEFDIGKLDGSHFWELNLAKGWSPDRMETAMTNGNGSVDQGRIQPLDELAKKPSFYLVPDNAWGPLSQLGLFSESERKQSPDSWSMAGIVPLHKGDWRRMNALQVVSTGRNDVRVQFPISVRYASWKKEVTSETSPFSTQEHEPCLSGTYGRRVWGLALSQPALDCGIKEIGPFYRLRLLYGVVGLDRYKDFLLDWPEKEVRYPRLYRKAENLERDRKAFAASWLPPEVKKTLSETSYVLTGDDAVAQKRLGHVLNRLNWVCNFCFTSPTVSHHAMAENYLFAAAADDILAWPGLPPGKRKEIRTRLALLCYLYEEPDVCSYANGAHHGNPNMGTARTMSMSTFMALVPDHPMFGKWREHAAAYSEYKAGTQVAPGGGYFEYGAAYHIHGGARTTNALPGLAAIGSPNMERLCRYFREDWDYYMNLLTPLDPRWKARMIPGMANSPPGSTEQLADAAGALAAYDPELASNLLWAWQANGANMRENAILLPVNVEPKEPELRSRLFPGVGVIFRAHQGPEETYMLFRAGFQWSHWYVDPGHFILYGRGAPLVPFQPYQYWWSPNKAFDMYNSMRFGHPENLWPHGWGDCNILDYAFGPTVDYAWSSTGFPDWFISPGASEEWREKSDAPVTQVEGRLLAEGFEHKQGAFEWNRQVVFLKGKTARSPNYFVFRDTVPGDGKLASFLFLNLLGRQSDVKADGDRLHVDTEWPTKMDVFFPHPGKVTPEFFEERQPIAFYNTNLFARLGKDAPCPRNWVEADGSPVKQLTGRHGSNTHEQHVILRLPGKPGEGYFWVIYPRGEGEPAPTVNRLADGVLKIAHPEGTDYVLVGTGLTKFEGEDVTLEGCAAAVRIRPDVVTLALTGGAGRVGYKGWVVEGIAPFERSVPVSQIKPGTERVPVPSSAISSGFPDPKGEKLAEGVWHLPGLTDYTVDSPTPVVFRDAKVSVEARKARILVEAPGIRFVVAEPLYAKLTVGNVGVRGVGPFSLLFSHRLIEGHVDGRMRSIVTTWPEGIVRPMYKMDGVRYCAGWADDHSIAKGTQTPQFAIGFGVSDGPHRVQISEWTYPPLPPSPQP